MNSFSDSEPLTDQERAQRRARWLRASVILLLAAGLLIGWLGYRSLVAYRIATYEALCAAALDQSQWGDLEMLAQGWMRWQPDSALPWLYASDGARGQGDLERSIQYLHQLPDGDAFSSGALLRLSDLLFHDKGSPLEAAEVCRRILEHDPRNVEAHRRLIYIYGMTLQRTKMMLQARRAMDLNCDLPETYIYLLGTDWISFAGAYELNTRWLENHPDEERYLISQTLHFAGMSSEDEAGEPMDELLRSRRAIQEQMVSEAFQRFPQNLELLVYYLRQASTDGDVQRVAELLSQAPPEALEDNRFWRFKGWLHAATGEHQAAKAAYEQALRRNPFDWRSQYELADVLRRLGLHDQVDRWAKLAMEGRALWREVLELPDVQSAPLPLMARIARYARDCGDNRVADCLEYRLTTTN
jgi:tetratricopeptide (TPR) repeat protein